MSKNFEIEKLEEVMEVIDRDDNLLDTNIILECSVVKDDKNVGDEHQR